MSWSLPPRTSVLQQFGHVNQNIREGLRLGLGTRAQNGFHAVAREVRFTAYLFSINNSVTSTITSGNAWGVALSPAFKILIVP